MLRPAIFDEEPVSVGIAVCDVLGFAMAALWFEFLFEDAVRATAVEGAGTFTAVLLLLALADSVIVKLESRFF